MSQIPTYEAAKKTVDVLESDRILSTQWNFENACHLNKASISGQKIWQEKWLWFVYFYWINVSFGFNCNKYVVQILKYFSFVLQNTSTCTYVTHQDRFFLNPHTCNPTNACSLSLSLNQSSKYIDLCPILKWGVENHAMCGHLLKIF